MPIYMRILLEILNCWIYDNCSLEFIRIIMIFYASISHPFSGFQLCHSTGWCRREDWGRVIVWVLGDSLTLLAFWLLLKSSCRLWFRTLSGFLFIYFCWIIMRTRMCMMIYLWDVEMLFYFINPLWLFMNFEKWIMHVLDYWRRSTYNLVFISDLLLNNTCGVWGYYKVHSHVD
jgi:hypothetical protein